MSTSIKQKLDYWPEDLVEALLIAYQDTRGFSDGEYFGRSQIISDTIYEKTAKFRSPREIRRKLMSMDLVV